MKTETRQRADYELRFESLFDPGRALAFPCDVDGRVDMDALSSPALNNYLYARAFVGREFFTPAVRRSEAAPLPRRATPARSAALLVFA
jgi:hypothetical protein